MIPKGVIDAVNIVRNEVGNQFENNSGLASIAGMMKAQQSGNRQKFIDAASSNTPMLAGMVGAVNAVRAPKMARGMANYLTNSERFLPSKEKTAMSIVDKNGNVIKRYLYDSLAMAKAQVDKVKGMLGKGEMLEPPTNVTPQSEILIKRIADLKAGGFSTVNAEKALAEELKLVKK